VPDILGHTLSHPTVPNFGEQLRSTAAEVVRP
jgi:hypothetical protein